MRLAILTPVAALAVASGLTMRTEAGKDPVPSPIVTATDEAQTLTAPATVAQAEAGSPARTAFTTRDASPDYMDIPTEVLGAYQRAELIMNRADTGCGLDWSLLAAIGYVESDHGRSAGSHVDADGVAKP
jgi:hypothetical protein